MRLVRWLARAPFWVLYGLSDVLYFLMVYVIRYRREVVAENLRLSFPEKSEAERRQIGRQFFRNLSDLIVEVIKLPHLSAADLQDRIKIEGLETSTEHLKAGKAVICLTLHSGNWEWGPAAVAQAGIRVDTVYKKLTTPAVETYMQQLRAHLGPVPVEMHQLPRRMVAMKNVPRLIGMVGDQIPDIPEFAFWTDFLHRDTPFYPGSERLARSQNLPVVYIEMVRIGRGRYRLAFSPLAEPPYDALPEGEILERYRDRLEATIRAHPADWLWSHKRWKHWRGKYKKLSVKLK